MRSGDCSWPSQERPRIVIFKDQRARLLIGGGGIAGETDLLVNYTFNIAFRDSGTNYGLASAIATVLFIIVGFLAWINLKMTGRNVKI